MVSSRGHARDYSPLVALGAIVAVGVGLRIAWCVYAARPPVGLIDPTFYAGHAMDLAHGKGYRYLGLADSAYYPPGYPFVLAAVVWLLERVSLTPSITTIACAVNVVAGAASIVLTYDITKRLLRSERAGLVAAACLALWPNLVFHSALILTETVCNLLLLVFVDLVVRADWTAGRLGTRRLVVVGVVAGMATLVRPVSIPIVLVIFVVALWPARLGVRKAATATAIVGAAALVVILPWTIRNAVVLHTAALVSTNVGDNLCIGNHAGASGAFELPPACFGAFDRLPRPAQELRRNSELTSRALHYALGHPVDELRLVAWRTFFTVEHDHDGLAAAQSYGADTFVSARSAGLLSAVADGWYFACVALAVLGFVRSRPGEDARRWLPVAMIAAVVLPTLVSFGDARFKVPAVPMLAIGVAAALVGW